MTLVAGTEAPDFTLKDQDGNDVTLSSFRGHQNVVLVFYAFAFSGICHGELCSVRDDLSQFRDAGAQVLAISCDSRFAHQQWQQQQHFDFPLLSDFWPHGAVARAYGVFNEQLGAANRATFVIDKQGTIVAVFESPNLATPRERDAYEAALAKLR
jgi:peroxiredoxin (alkyl hydroperoxide reductase subunit C)